MGYLLKTEFVKDLKLLLYRGENYMRNISGMLTPQGLKVRLDSDFCGGLPLKNGKTVNDLLIETETFVCTEKWAIFIIGILAFLFKIPNNTLFVLSFATVIITSLTSWIHPLFMLIRGTITLTEPRIFVRLTGWFVDKIALIVIGVFTIGWKGLLYYAVGYVIATFLAYIFNIFIAKSNYSQFGVALQSDEMAFIFLSLRHMERVSFMDWIKSYYSYLNSES